MTTATESRGPSNEFAGVAIVERSPHLAVALARFLAQDTVVLSGEGTASLAELGEIAVQWATHRGSDAKVLLVPAEVAQEGELRSSSALNGIKLARTIQAALPHLTIFLFGVMPEERLRRRAGGSMLEYVDLIVESADLPRRIRAHLTAGIERISATPIDSLPTGLVETLVGLSRDLAPALAEAADEAMIETAVVRAFDKSGWSAIQSACANLIIPSGIPHAHVVQLRHLRARVVGLGAMVRGVAAARGADARRHLVTEYLERIDLVRRLLAQQRGQQ